VITELGVLDVTESGFALVERTPAVSVEASVMPARHAVATALPHTHRTRLSDDLGLLASELVTNAVVHGPRPAEDHVIELVLWPAGGHYWLAVSDGAGGLPALASPRLEACGGKGLLLVDALSAAWAVVPRPVTGKSVIAGIRPDGASKLDEP
jgi:hypothetical protein